MAQQWIDRVMIVINRDSFRIDVLPPLVGTAISTFVTSNLLTSRIAGHLVHHLISPQSAFIISAITSFSSALFQNFIENRFLKFLAIPLAYSLAILSHRFIYPGIKWNHIIDPKGTVAILTIITFVKLIMERTERAPAEP